MIVAAQYVGIASTVLICPCDTSTQHDKKTKTDDYATAEAR